MGVREVVLRQSAASRLGHFTDEAVAEGPSAAHNCSDHFPGPIAMFLNLLLFSQLRARCNPQQFFCDTVTVVHTHPPEAV
jgi:hypothetical protein